MDHEQKYNEALERAKKAITECGDNEGRKNMIRSIFPELKESKDEKIREKLIVFLQKEKECVGSGLTTKNSPRLAFLVDALAWLEKQKSVTTPKFRIGDNVVSTKNPRLTYKVLEVGNVNELGNLEYKVEIFTDGKEEKPRNIRYMECNKMDEWGELIEQKPAEWCEEDENIRLGTIELLEQANHPNRVHCDGKPLDFTKNIEWLKSLKHRIKAE